MTPRGLYAPSCQLLYLGVVLLQSNRTSPHEKPLFKYLHHLRNFFVRAMRHQQLPSNETTVQVLLHRLSAIGTVPHASVSFSREKLELLNLQSLSMIHHHGAC